MQSHPKGGIARTPRVFLNQMQKAIRLQLRIGEDEVEIPRAHRFGHSLAQHLAKIRGDGEIATFIQLSVRESWPAAVDLAALHLAAQHKHRVGVAVIGAAGAVLARGAAKL